MSHFKNKHIELLNIADDILNTFKNAKQIDLTTFSVGNPNLWSKDEKDLYNEIKDKVTLI